MIVRRLLVVLAGLLLGAQVVRNSAVAALAEFHPDSAARLWAAHPSVELADGLARIGLASRQRQPVSGSTFAMIDDAAVKAPLSPEPFLVHGVRAQLAGDPASARRNFEAAQWRDPRSLPAAYFLADYYLRSGQPLAGLRQTALVARLSPGGPGAIAPFVAAYAQEPANWPQIRGLFQSDPTVEEGVLEALASDPDNAAAVLALADSTHRDARSPWLAILVRKLVDAGQYGRAHAIWSALAAGPSAGRAPLYDSGFSQSAAPPPFNWALTSSGVGLAERQHGDRLHVIFYGEQDGVLAAQLLLLAPGTYRLRVAVSPGAVHPELLGWSVRCDKSTAPISTVSLDRIARGWTFAIPANCPAQWLELSGTSGDVAQQADVTIGSLALTREGAGA